MIRKTILTIATATVISAAALGATASTASAGFKVYFNHGYGHGGWRHGWGHGGYGHYKPCRRWLRKYNWSGRHRFLRKYRRCMRYY